MFSFFGGSSSTSPEATSPETDRQPLGSKQNSDREVVVPSAATSADQLTYDEAFNIWLAKNPEATEHDFKKEMIASHPTSSILFGWMSSDSHDDYVDPAFWHNHRPYLIKGSGDGQRPDNELNEVQKVRKELESRTGIVSMDDEVRNVSAHLIPKASAINESKVSVPVGVGKLPAMEVSVINDQVLLIQQKTLELGTWKDNYSKLALDKEAADRRIAQLLAEIEANRIKYDSNLRKMESDFSLMKNEYDVRIIKLEGDVKRAKDETDATKRDYEAHMVLCKAAAAAAAKRIADLDSQLLASQKELSTHLAECTSSKAQLTLRLTDLTTQQKKTTDELDDLMKRFMELSAAKVKTDSLNGELQTQTKNDAMTIIELRARIKELEGDLKLCKSSDLALEAQIATFEDQMKAAQEEIARLRQELALSREAKYAADKKVDALDAQARLDRDEIERLKRKLLDAELQSKRDADEIERLTKEIASLKALQAVSDLKVADLEGQAKKDKDEIERLKRLLTDAEIKAIKDENEIQLLKKQVDDLSTRFATAKAAADKLIAELQDEIAALKRKISDLESQLDKNGKQGSDELSALKKRIAELEVALNKCTEDLSAATIAKATADKQVGVLTAQGKKDADEIASLKKRVAELEAAKVIADRSITDLTAVHVPCGIEIAALKKRVAELEAAKVIADRSIADLTAVHVPCGAEIAALKKRVAELEAAKVLADRTIADLTAAHAPCAQKLADALKDKGLSADMAAALAAKDKRIAELEALLKKANDNIASLQAAAATAATELAALRAGKAVDQATIDDLRRQLAAMTAKNKALEDQAKIDQATIEDLRRQLAELQRLYAELMSRQHAEDEVDKKRIADLQAVNDTLLRLARERAFQDDLKLPLVRVAMDIFNGDADKHSEATQEAARFDEGVNRIFPRMKAFEVVCDAARIKFPVDHILAGKTELSAEAVTYAFGPDFVAKHHIVGQYK